MADHIIPHLLTDGGADEIDVAIYNGYIYILDGDRILKSNNSD